MINIILILLFINVIINVIFKPKHNILCCGIIAWAGKNPKQFNKSKFDILGIFNDVRGGDSCGVSVDGDIFYGLTLNTKHYKNFLVEKNYDAPITIPVVIAHTRKSSVGVVNEHNAHPFGFGNNDKIEGYEFIGCHNGTLYNHEDLAKEFNIELTINDKVTNAFVRRKIDSEVLLESIYLSKNFKVLSKYNGGAAIVFFNTLEPDTIYAFHGKSADGVNQKETEERPLYYYSEGKNSLYISSIAESLIAIGGKIDENVFEFEHNYVYKIKNGDISKAHKYQVSRTNVFQKRTYSYPSTNNHTNAYSCVDDDCYTGTQRENVNARNVRNYVGSNIEKQIESFIQEKRGVKEEEKITNIYNENADRYGISPVVFQKLRYHRNGHNISGAYTFIEGYGFHFLNKNADTAIEEAYKLVDRSFNYTQGYFPIEPNNRLNNADYGVPFEKGGITPSIIFFYDGIMLQTRADYEALMSYINLHKDLDNLSMCSRHPICDDTLAHRSDSSQNVRFNGELYTGRIKPLGSNRIYVFEEGNLIKVRKINLTLEKPKQVTLFDSPKVIPLNESNTVKRIENFINNDVDEEEEYKINLEEMANNLIRIMDAALMNVLDEADSSKTELEKLNIPDNPQINQTITLFDEIMDSIKEHCENVLNIKNVE